MPLSEEELRLLEQMERALVAEDPKLASTLRGTRLRQRARRQVVIGAVGFVLGLGALMAGVVLPMVAVGIVGFLLMLGSAYLALSSWRARDAAAAAPSAPEDPGPLRVIRGGKAHRGRAARAPKRGTSHGSMMERFEERWRRRREGGNGF
ncbi:DUF3040 domain-containing protein [Nocardioides marmoribigeumensis]|uniref:Preprotein translocase subunit Sss1 n=1 Tax=Nocardioides marmoribigeumensis TaxID=433649 RepID=A0ABU2BRM3_9ACTN|nr:DUF3040 domain-containing protein [Nocardioides marmoribigeumensis]MDR7361295.1 preprotein translocase subunit Sss1 [Nocardioides marmoribigeumensis]